MDPLNQIKFFSFLLQELRGHAGASRFFIKLAVLPFAYRPVLDFKGARTKISARINLIDMESFAPGTSGIVQITFLKGMINDNYFKKGQLFTVSEGGNYNLGKDRILEVIR